MENHSSKPSILKSIPAHEAQFLVHAQAAYYPDFIRIYIPKTPYAKLLPGLESPTVERGSKEPKTSNETNEERSVRKTRRSIKDYVLCNPFEHFATFTFAKDRQDLSRCKSKMSNWISGQRKTHGKFSYLIVPELHKDGESLHFHALLGGFKGKVARSLNADGSEKSIKGRAAYHLPGYRLGFSDVKIVDKEDNTSTRVASYIQKYITKDMPIFPGKKRYWCSRGLAKPKYEDNPQKWYEHIKPDREYINEHGKLLEFNAGTHELTDIYHEARM